MSLSKTKKFIALGIVLLCAASAGSYLNQPESSKAVQTTTDAYIQADFTYVSPKVTGQINRVYAEDNQRVEKGQRLVDIEANQFDVIVQKAQAKLETARANIGVLEANLGYQHALLEQANADVAATTSMFQLAEKNVSRYKNLANDGSGTVLDYQEAQSKLDVTRAQLLKNKAKLDSVHQQIAITKANIVKAKSQQALAEAELAQAKLNQSYTQIVAPISGIISHKTVRKGSYVKPGESLLAIVPLQSLYIEANYRETQLQHIEVGQPVNITVDALAGQVFKGHVESIAAASSVSFSAVAPHNATGNFTKIVQRLPIKIVFDDNQSQLSKLKVGMSVVPSIQTQN